MHYRHMHAATKTKTTASLAGRQTNRNEGRTKWSNKRSLEGTGGGFHMKQTKQRRGSREGSVKQCWHCVSTPAQHWTKQLENSICFKRTENKLSWELLAFEIVIFSAQRLLWLENTPMICCHEKLNSKNLTFSCCEVSLEVLHEAKEWKKGGIPCSWFF